MNNSTRRRNRACEECHRLKIKCDVSTSPGVACDRCIRNNLECVPAAPRLQRDRINELEAQIEELRNAIREQSSSMTPSRSPGRALEDHNQTILAFLDARIPLNKQQELLHFYANHAGAAWPIVRMPVDLYRIRAMSPVLLLSVLVHCVTHETQGTELDVHDALVRETMHILGDEIIGRGQRSLELVQALLVAAFWCKPTRGEPQASCYQLVQLAADMAIDLGIAGASLQPSPVAYFSRYEEPGSLEARRTWLACYLALSASSISMRRPNPFPWNAHHEECLAQLESRGEPSDILLCQIVRIVQLDQEISTQLCLCQVTTFVDGNDYPSHTVIELLKSKVVVWAARIPPTLASSQTLKIWGHVAIIHIYELVLHTPTNKATFAAPFIPGRIAVKDFPRPDTIIPPLELALDALVQNCHAVLDIAAEMDPALVLSLPTFCFAPYVLYSLFVLVNVLVAATDPANTYGRCLTRESFRIKECSQNLRNVTRYAKSLDPTMSSFATRMFDATTWLEEWYNDYTAILQRYETSLTN